MQTVIGGWTGGGHPGDFVEAQLADHSLKPIITRVETKGWRINPRALCFDPVYNQLYYSDLGTRSIKRIAIRKIDGGALAVVEFDTFLPEVGLVYGMAVDAKEGNKGGFLYFSDIESGTVSRVELPTTGQPTAASQVLVSGVTTPMGVALEPNGGSRLMFTLYGGSIRAVLRDGSTSTTVPQTATLKGGGYEVRRFDSGTRLDGIAISASEAAGNDPIELRLYWSESGRTPAIRRSTMDGTRPEYILTINGGTGSTESRRKPLIWPRGLAFGANTSAGLLFCERLGSIRLLPDLAVGDAETVVEEDSYPAALAIQALFRRARKKGIKEGYFMETVR